ncbi:GNAT family N-acetyltransferase [Iamia majanohamensis]|uniref:GNAT family N-acetyltransferase n=1 Tax=Iamia majanohamensis TaxID=467976 RepID=A0AAF0BUQ2_9ACTN|nr:GNAT family N-acetyltransferase [Iamia majanohamensis]WCO65649.1 GNAT family N-acetyltransferase [Iamia majanohamensis]
MTGPVGEDGVEITVQRIGADEGARLRRVRLDAIVDSPGEFTTRLEAAEARPQAAWDRVAEAHSAADDQATWFAEVGGETAGMISAFRTDDGAVTMTSLWSAPGFRRMGVADQLVSAVRDWARAAGATELRQWLVERNAHARAFHDALGFVPTGAERPFEPHPALREVELRLALR